MAKGIAAASIIPSLAKAESRHKEVILKQRTYSANENIQVALIGAGGMGNADNSTAVTVPGVKLIAACDLYDGRLNDIKKKYGNDIFVTKEFREILSRKDIDAVIVATPDHWHQEISIAAMNAGKAVYCEKSMVHDITEGPAVIEAQTKNKSIFQVITRETPFNGILPN
ncbi:MAG: Gfo/Idh/MocA family oxidoreductase [Bacteroidota bacterium]